MLHELAAIERARTALDLLAVPLTTERRMRRESRVRVAHNSTWIENRTLDLDEARTILARSAKDPTRETAQAAIELRNYWDALAFLGAHLESPWSEELLQELHALVERGLRGRGRPRDRSAYRTANLQVGNMAYLPPEWQDVPGLMADLVAWLRKNEGHVPTPLFAAIAAYQFVTIHPFGDGNGRTCRLLATFCLQRGGYGLRGLAAMESFYARDLEGYYGSLQMGLHHNYYLANDQGSRSDPDLTPWIEHFLDVFARSAEQVYEDVLHESRAHGLLPANPLHDLPRAVRRVLGEIEDLHVSFTPTEVATWFGVDPKTARAWLADWCRDRHFAPSDPSAQRIRRYVVHPDLTRRIEAARLA